MQRARSSELEKEIATGMREGRDGLEGVWRGRNGEGCQPKRGLMLPHMYPSIGSARWADEVMKKRHAKPSGGSLSSGPPRKYKYKI